MCLAGAWRVRGRRACRMALLTVLIVVGAAPAVGTLPASAKRVEAARPESNGGMPSTAERRAVCMTSASGPRYRETSRPDGPPAGMLLLLHGGDWQSSCSGVEELRPTARRFASYGWEIWNADYRSGRRSLDDVGDLYDEMDLAGGLLPNCVVGYSAGAHLALMLASLRAPDCVIGSASPTDLRTLPAAAHALAVATFGRENLTRYSPITRIASVSPQTRILLGHARADTVVPAQQTIDYVSLRGADTVGAILDKGDERFTHAPVDRLQLMTYAWLQRRLLRQVALGR